VESDRPNYPLFRKYFKIGNPELLHLLLEGLCDSPTNHALLYGLSYFHENKNILKQIIGAYIEAVGKENDEEVFRGSVLTLLMILSHMHGYDALAELKSMFQGNIGKITVVDEIGERLNKDELVVF